MISRWLCAVYNLARVKSIKRNVEHTVHGYIRIIKLNITIAKDRSYSKLLSEKFSPPNFPERWITTKKEINLDIDFCSNSIDRLQRTETNEERIFRVKDERCSYQLPSLPWSKRRRKRGRRGCKLSRESGEERFKSDLHDIWPAHSPGTLFRVTILSRRFRVCIKISTTANSDLATCLGPTKKPFARTLLGIMAHCRELDKAFLSRTTRYPMIIVYKFE